MLDIPIEIALQEIIDDFRNRSRDGVARKLESIQRYVLDMASGPTVPDNVLQKSQEFASDLTDLIELVDQIDIEYFDDLRKDFNDRMIYFTRYILFPWLSQPDVQARLQAYQSSKTVN